jgi:phospholipase B1
VIGAIGNSLTAGLLVLGTFQEYKGLAFSGGGLNTVDLVTTLPNILKEYNPDLVGFNSDLDNPFEESLNVGFSGAITANMSLQTTQLIERMKNHPNIDFYKDWKVVTVFLGYNDICDFSCFNNSLDYVDQWINNIDESLVYMRDHLPRTFVNLMLVGHLSTGLQYTEVAPRCAQIAIRLCKCIFSGDAVAISDMVVDEFNRRLIGLVNSRKYDTTNDFTVVVQPYLSTSQPLRDANGIVDISYVAIDCVHLSANGNRVYATGLWENMLQPVGAKGSLTADDPPVCPSQDFPYFYTYLNSAGCPPLCTHKFCSATKTRRADCTM